MQHLKTVMLSLKVLFVSVAVIFTALGVKAFLPLATTHLPLLWTFFLLCFTPPYLYVTVNAIIISILASSRFQFHHSPAQPNHPTPPPVLEVKAVLVHGPAMVEEEEEEEAAETKEIDPGTALKTMDSPEIPPAYLPPVDKPLVSAKFSDRKPLKSSPEGGRALRVAKAKRHETLENTWKAITEGRTMPLSRHMKKCDTWQNRGNTGPLETEATTVASDGESETFDFKAAAAARLRKEPSLSQDELNRRAEAFIRNFNQQMRLQRQESLNHYMQMINRGAS